MACSGGLPPTFPLSLVTPVTLSNEPSAADSVPVTSAAQSLLLPTVSRRCPCARGIQAVWGGGAWNLLPFQVRVGRLEAALLPLGNARNRLLPFLPSHSCGRLCAGRGCAGRRLRRRWRRLSVPCRRQQRREGYRHEADSSQAPMPADCSCHILPPNIFEDRQRPVRSPPPLMERRRPRSVQVLARHDRWRPAAGAGPLSGEHRLQPRPTATCSTRTPSAPPARGAAPTASALPDAPPRPTGTKSGHMTGVSQAPGLILAAKSAAAPRTSMGVRTALA